jgi:hypothetical protein
MKLVFYCSSILSSQILQPSVIQYAEIHSFDWLLNVWACRRDGIIIYPRDLSFFIQIERIVFHLINPYNHDQYRVNILEQYTFDS